MPAVWPAPPRATSESRRVCCAPALRRLQAVPPALTPRSPAHPRAAEREKHVQVPARADGDFRPLSVWRPRPGPQARQERVRRRPGRGRSHAILRTRPQDGPSASPSARLRSGKRKKAAGHAMTADEEKQEIEDEDADARQARAARAVLLQPAAPPAYSARCTQAARASPAALRRARAAREAGSFPARRCG